MLDCHMNCLQCGQPQVVLRAGPSGGPSLAGSIRTYISSRLTLAACIMGTSSAQVSSPTFWKALHVNESTGNCMVLYAGIYYIVLLSYNGCSKESENGPLEVQQSLPCTMERLELVSGPHCTPHFWSGFLTMRIW